MFLKHLAIEGFKSFPEQNRLEMSPGTCVLVGANGTGKSNVTDAISWVLGEDDLAALRCPSPDELIFAGNQELHPIDSGRVSAVLDTRPERTRDGSLPLCAAKHGQRSEHDAELPTGALTITREAHRARGNHYYLDGEEASRKEVHEALRALGIPPTPVKTIRQGEVENLLVTDPITRRCTIESLARIPQRLQRLRTIQKKWDDLDTEHEQLLGEEKEILLSWGRAQEEYQTMDTTARIEEKLHELQAEAVVHAVTVLTHNAGSQDDSTDATDSRQVTSHRKAMVAELLQSLELPPAPYGPSREEWSSLRRHIQDCADRLAALGPTNARANADGQQILERKNQVENRVTECRQEMETCAAHLKEEKEAVRAAFHEALARVKKRFATYYSLLAPGGKANLTLISGPEAVGTEDECREGVEVFVRPPGKSLDRVDSLSGGERSLAGLALALAVFQEGESPLFVLDEVEPALDDSNIRRVQTLLDKVADHRQVILVSHQQRAKETGDVVFGMEQNLDGASQIKFRYEPRTRRLDVFRRTWTSPHIRRRGDGDRLNRVGQNADGSWRGIWDVLEAEKNAPCKPCC